MLRNETEAERWRKLINSIRKQVDKAAHLTYGAGLVRDANGARESVSDDDAVAHAMAYMRNVQIEIDRHVHGETPPPPGDNSKPGWRKDIPLHLLNTPANRAFADALREAQTAAAAVDRERGVKPEEGTSSLMAYFADQVEAEIYGPASAHE